MIGEFKKYKGVRQDCPLSSSRFNWVFADLEEVIRRVQEEGIVIERKKIWSMGFSDNVTLLAETKKGMKEMLRKLKKFLESRGLELNLGKSKMMECRKGGGRR